MTAKCNKINPSGKFWNSAIFVHCNEGTPRILKTDHFLDTQTNMLLEGVMATYQQRSF